MLQVVPLLVVFLARSGAAAEPESASDPYSGGGGGSRPLRNASPGEAYTQWTGFPVLGRSIEHAAGSASAEDLEALLRVRVGAAYHPFDVRDDLATLHRVLHAARVEARVIPVAPRADDLVEGVRVVYAVTLPPRLHRLRFAGNRVYTDAALRGVVALDQGDAFFPEDLGRIERAVAAAYTARGWPRATAAARVVREVGHDVEVGVTVAEGVRQRVASIDVAQNAAISRLRVSWILARAGVVAGTSLPEGALVHARESLLERLREEGWWEARVTLRPEPVSPTSDRVVVLVDAGRRWSIKAEGDGLPSRRELAERVRADGRLPSDEMAGALARGLSEELHAAGWTDAEVTAQTRQLASVARGEAPGETHKRRGRASLEVHATPGARRHLQALRFEGDTVFGASYLRDALREASPDLLAEGWVTREALDRALLATREFFRARGYLDATLVVSGYVEGAPRRKGRRVDVDVTIRVNPGAQVTLRGLEAPPPVDDVDPRSFLADLVGAPCNPAEFDLRARRIVEALAARGRLDADARVRLVREGGSPDATAIVEVTPGETVYLRSVVIEGYRRTRRSLVASLVDPRPGSPVSPPAVDAVRQRLYGLDVFSKVLVDLEGEDSHARDLRVTLEEKAPVYLEVGGGAATDQGVRSFVRAGHRNLLGLGHRVTLVGQAGLGWVGDGWTLDATAPEWRAALRYEAPRLPRASDSLAADILLQERQQEPAWRMERSGIGGSVRLQGTGGLAVDLGYQIQSRRLLDLDPGVLLDDEVWLGPLGLSERGLDPRPATPSAARVQSGPTVSVVLDRRNDAFTPTDGTLASLLLAGADPWLSERAFLRGEAGWTRWATLDGFGFQLRGRAGGGWATGNASLPLEDRFRLGGAATVRGFDLDAIGPANLVSREAVDWPEGLAPLADWSGRDGAGRWVPTGGDVMALASAEVRIPFERLRLPGEGADLALFTDVGNTWLLASGSRADSARLGAEPAVRVGVGLGVRQSTPIGPVQADVGFNPWRVDARDEPLARFHVTLGAL